MQCMEVWNLGLLMEIFRSRNVTEEAEVVEVNFKEGCAVSRAAIKELTSEAIPKPIISLI